MSESFGGSEEKLLNESNKYELKGVLVEFMDRPYVASESNGQAVIEIPVAITDPNAPEPFNNVQRWSKYSLTIDSQSGEVLSSSRIDSIQSASEGSVSEVYYQIHTDEVQELLNTRAISNLVENLKTENA